MSYLTHSKFFTMMIPDILPLFPARFKFFWLNFVIRNLFCPRFEIIENFDISFLFRTSFGILHELILSARGFEFLMIIKPFFWETLE